MVVKAVANFNKQIFDQGKKQIGVVQRQETVQNLEPPPTQGGGGS